jgi:hypothetical protein
LDSVSSDDVINYTVNQHKLNAINDADIKESDINDTLLAHMAGRYSSSGDIRFGLTAKKNL